MEEDSYSSKFQYPIDLDSLYIENQHDRMCVVSIVGKQKFSSHLSKASRLNGILKCNAFQPSRNVPNVAVEGFLDMENHVIYLHLSTLADARTLSDMISRAEHEESFWEDADCDLARGLLFIFSVSHIILLVSPAASLDTSYLRLFRLIDEARLKIQPYVSELLENYGASPEWVSYARPCAPRVLFIMDQCSLRRDELQGENGGKYSLLKKLEHKLEDQIYDILRKLRVITNNSNNSLFAVPVNEEYVFVNIDHTSTSDIAGFYLKSLNQICTASKEAVKTRRYQAMRHQSHDLAEARQSTGRVLLKPETHLTSSTHSLEAFLMPHVRLALDRGFDDNIGRNPAPAVFELVPCAMWFHLTNHLFELIIVCPRRSALEPYISDLGSSLQVNSKFSEARCEKVLPVAVSAYQEGLPSHYTLDYHHQKLALAERVFLHQARGPETQAYLKQLGLKCTQIWTSGRQLCEALSLTGRHCIYQLHHVPGEVNEGSELQVMLHFSQCKTRATCNCGRRQSDRDDPFTIKDANFTFYEGIEPQCCSTLEHWFFPVFTASSKDARAFTGKPGNELGAVMSLHSLGQSGDLDPFGRDGISGMYTAELSQGYAAAIKSLASTIESQEEDGAEEGGTDAGKKAEDNKNGEGHSEGHSSNNSAGSAGNDQSPVLGLLSQGSSPQESPSAQAILSAPDVNAAHPNGPDVNAAQPNGPDVAAAHPDSPDITAAHPDGPDVLSAHSEAPDNSVAHSDAPTDTSRLAHSQHSTTEYLPGMIHSECPGDLLPAFPSWSLVRLGDYSFYNSSSGVDLPNFSHQCNYLLPWDVRVTKKEAEKYEGSGGGGGGGGGGKGKHKFRKFKADNPVTEIFRVYLGLEYECPRGHRFFLSAPDRVFKAPSSGVFKEMAYKIVESDMPLYFPCTCRSSKGFMAILQRLHAVVPKGPVEVSLHPKVRPGMPPCPLFYPTQDGPVKIPSPGWWVLRFPYIYGDDNGPYNMPSDPQELIQCRLMKEHLTVSTTT